MLCDKCAKTTTWFASEEPTTADEYNNKWLKKESARKYFAAHGLYYKDDIREAVDLAIGDDGFRSKEVIEILKTDIGG